MARVQSEMQLYVSQDPSKKRSHRDVCTKKIQELEAAGKSLRDKQKLVKETAEPNQRLMEQWRDLVKLLECKRQMATSATRDGEAGTQDRLVF